jgi:hypothetical protein
MTLYIWLAIKIKIIKYAKPREIIFIYHNMEDYHFLLSMYSTLPHPSHKYFNNSTNKKSTVILLTVSSFYNIQFQNINSSV